MRTLALHGALWELDQEIALFAEDEPRLVATVMAYAEQLMEKVALRAQTAPRLGAFTGGELPGRGGRFHDLGLHARRARRAAPR